MKAMKRVLLTIGLMALFHGALVAQTAQNLTRTVLAVVPEKETVEQGAFQMELNKASDFKVTGEDYWFSYVYTTENRYVDKGNVMVKDRPLIVDRNMQVRTYRITPLLNQCIFVLKNADHDKDDIGYGMEVVRAYGVPHPVCDSVMSLDDDGYVYRLNDQYFYSEYKRVFDNQPKTVPVVWLEQKRFDGNLVNSHPGQVLSPEKKASLARLSKGAVYYESPDGHYYYLYRDDYMPNTVLVVDNRVVELFDQYDDKDFRLKFSYDGNHWMAVGQERYWVDGELKSIAGYAITDYVVTDEGHYAYKAYQIGASDRGEVVVVDGQVIRRNAEVCYFGLNAEGRLKFRFISGGRLLQYENEKTSDVTASLTSVYYPGNVMHNRLVTVMSNDGLHKLTYRMDQPSVEIDGEKVSDSAPCYAIFDEKNSMFIWNAIERKEHSTELVVYKYAIVNNFFRKVFR